jgi:hypothetical protein
MTTTPDTTRGSAPSWFVGAWKREWTRPRGGTACETSIVRDLQTPSIFGSVRIPLHRPAFPRAQSFADLDDIQLAALLTQRGGFAGTASFVGENATSIATTTATWQHEIDFQPRNGIDSARLTQTGATTVFEEAIDESGDELWCSISSGDEKCLGLKITRAERVERMLIVVGDHFVYARNRTRDLPDAPSLTELVATTHATRAQIIEMLDCELSYGLVRGGRVAWEVRLSTLPWREGEALEFASEVVIDPTVIPRPRAPRIGEAWTVPVNTMTREELAAMFGGWS